jgi:glutamate-1-semialdehyde 2,1-aminomutase
MQDWFERALEVLPGGVNSPVRAFGAVGGRPVVIRSGEGTTVHGENGRSYLDFVCSWGPLILGHAHPVVTEAIQKAAARGTTYGAPCRGEVELAEKMVASYPGLEQLRCVSSGTEATMSAIRVARGYTGRDRILKFAGCYHGHADHLLTEAGSGLVTFSQPSSAGVPAAFAQLTSVLPLDDIPALEAFFAEFGGEVAAVIIEPIPANNGLLLQRPAFLKRLRDLTKIHGTVLIFDEVISGFRVARGGAAELYGIVPDMVTFGKVIGGGMPVGAFGASREIMAKLSPLGPVYQAGTLSGNPLAMAAGLATLSVLEEEDGWARLERSGAALQALMEPVLAKAPWPMQLVRVGSVFWLCFAAGEAPRRADQIGSDGAEKYKPLFHGLLERGVSIAPSAYEVGFLSLAHTLDDLERFTEAIASTLAEMSRL